MSCRNLAGHRVPFSAPLALPLPYESRSSRSPVVSVDCSCLPVARIVQPLVLIAPRRFARRACIAFDPRALVGALGQVLLLGGLALLGAVVVLGHAPSSLFARRASSAASSRCSALYCLLGSQFAPLGPQASGRSLLRSMSQ